MSAIVAIVGRPNVGKSTFFNRLIQRREAIVDAVSGVTRDRHYGKSDWNGKEFSVIDTGGYVLGSDDVFEKEIDKQISLRVSERQATAVMHFMCLFCLVDLTCHMVEDKSGIGKFLQAALQAATEYIVPVRAF